MKELLFAILVVYGCLSHSNGQTTAPTVTPSPSAEATPSPSPTPSPDDRNLRDGMKNMADDSRSVLGWGLTLMGASILAIVSTSYLRPLSRKFRNVYLLFIPGWMLVAVSVYFGNKVSRRHTAATFAQNRRRLLEIGSLMNQDFDWQLSLFNWGLIVFAIWLLIYLIWWVRTDMPVTGDK